MLGEACNSPEMPGACFRRTRKAADHTLECLRCAAPIPIIEAMERFMAPLKEEGEQMDGAQAQGVAMTAELLERAYPIVNGQPPAIVVQAMAGAMLATCRLAAKTEAGVVIMLRRFANTLNVTANELATAELPAVPVNMDNATLRFMADHLAALILQERKARDVARESRNPAVADRHEDRADALADVAARVRFWAAD